VRALVLTTLYIHFFPPPSLLRLDLSGLRQDLQSGLRVNPEAPDEVHTFYVGASCADRMLLYHGLACFRTRLKAGVAHEATREQTAGPPPARLPPASLSSLLTLLPMAPTTALRRELKLRLSRNYAHPTRAAALKAIREIVADKDATGKWLALYK
jgi:hypothetical protein